MKWRRSGGEEFAVCEFCDSDDSQVRVRALGDKGICKSCLRSLMLLLRVEREEFDAQVQTSINRTVRQ